MTAAQNRRRLAIARATGTASVATPPETRKATQKEITGRRNRCESLMALTAAREGYTLTELREQNRRPEVVAARRAVMLAAHRADFTLEDIGHVLHRHYTSVLSALRRVEAGEVSPPR